MEDFVPYEVAVKLGQKGFKQGYNIFGFRPIFSNETTIRFISDIGAYEKEYFGENITAPTISQVLKWLREEKKIYIVIQPFPTMATKNKICWSWDFKWNSDGAYIEHTFPDDVTYTTYEQAVLAGILYVLNNLI